MNGKAVCSAHQAMQHWQYEYGGLAGAGLCQADDVTTHRDRRDCLQLNRCGGRKNCRCYTAATSG